LIFAADGGGNCGVWVGVLGDESCAESGEEYVSKAAGLCSDVSGWGPLGATDVTFESTRDPVFPSLFPSPFACSPSTVVASGFLDALTAVLAFEFLDFTDTFDLTPLSFLVLPKKEFLELGLDSVSSSSCNFVILVGVAFRC
jgi:hypothetical protein